MCVVKYFCLINESVSCPPPTNKPTKKHNHWRKDLFRSLLLRYHTRYHTRPYDDPPTSEQDRKQEGSSNKANNSIVHSLNHQPPVFVLNMERKRLPQSRRSTGRWKKAWRHTGLSLSVLLGVLSTACHSFPLQQPSSSRSSLETFRMRRGNIPRRVAASSDSSQETPATGAEEDTTAAAVDTSLLNLLSPPPPCDVDRMSSTDLAYVGDVVYELLVRSKKVWPPKRTSHLQSQVVGLVRGTWR